MSNVWWRQVKKTDLLGISTPKKEKCYPFIHIQTLPLRGNLEGSEQWQLKENIPGMKSGTWSLPSCCGASSSESDRTMYSWWGSCRLATWQEALSSSLCSSGIKPSISFRYWKQDPDLGDLYSRILVWILHHLNFSEILSFYNYSRQTMAGNSTQIRRKRKQPKTKFYSH